MKSICLTVILLSLVCAASSLVIPVSMGASSTASWEVSVEPTAPFFRSVEQAQIILRVENGASTTRRIMIPYRQDARWPQWIHVYRDGRRVAPKEGTEFVAVPTTLRTGESLSLLLSLREFYEAGAILGIGEGEYRIEWKGTPIGRSNNTSGHFEIIADDRGESTSPLETILSQVNGTMTDKRDAFWQRLLSAPSNAELVSVLRELPEAYLEENSLLALLGTSNDIGVRREALHVLRRFGHRPDLTRFVEDYLAKQVDEPLIRIGVGTLRVLRGEKGR